MKVGAIAEELQRLPGGTRSNLDAPSQALESFRIAEFRGFQGHIVTRAVIQPCNDVALFVRVRLRHYVHCPVVIEVNQAMLHMPPLGG